MSHCDVHQNFVTLGHSSKWMSYCDIQGNCGIITYMKVVDCDIQELCHIAMLIKVELLYNMSHVN